jgi:hypothetical protein
MNNFNTTPQKHIMAEYFLLDLHKVHIAKMGKETP